MTRLFKRGCKVTLITPRRLPGSFFEHEPGPENAVEITDMRVKFSIVRSVKQEPDKCELVISNLAERTRALAEKKPLTVWIDAGYDGELHQLFTGDVRHAYSELKKPEWETIFQLGDGDRAYRLARINKSYSGGTSVEHAVKDCAATMGLQLAPGELSRLADLQKQFVGAQAVQGSTRDELTRLLSPLGVQWSMQGGRLLLLRDGDVADGQAILVSEETGLIDTPRYTTPAVSSGKPPALVFKMQLYPQLAPGKLVEVHSKAIKGKLFRIQKVEHKGDTHGQDWTSTVEAIPADLSTPDVKVSAKPAEGAEPSE